ncbi:MAG TPA: hypothetical protein VGD98_19025 [Ktedonobacteraceae bacterium]
MLRAGILVEKELALKGIFQGEEHSYVSCILADANDPTRQFECRVLDEMDIPFEPGQPITLEVIHVVTDRKNGKVRFDCRLP